MAGGFAIADVCRRGWLFLPTYPPPPWGVKAGIAWNKLEYGLFSLTGCSSGWISITSALIFEYLLVWTESGPSNRRRTGGRAGPQGNGPDAFGDGRRGNGFGVSMLPCSLLTSTESKVAHDQG